MIYINNGVISKVTNEILEYFSQPKEVKYPILTSLMKKDKPRIHNGIIRAKK